MATSIPQVTIRYERRRVEDIKDHPQNPNVHPDRQARALRDVIDHVGVADVILVNERTGHCLDGHLRLNEARKNREEFVDCGVVDIPEEQERAALGTIDPIGRLVRAHPEMQRQLLEKIPRVLAAVKPMDLGTARGKLEAAQKAAGTSKPKGEPKTEVVARRPTRLRPIGFDNETDRLEWARWTESLGGDLGATQGERVIGYFARAKEAGIW